VPLMQEEIDYSLCN